MTNFLSLETLQLSLRKKVYFSILFNVFHPSFQMMVWNLCKFSISLYILILPNNHFDFVSILLQMSCWNKDQNISFHIKIIPSQYEDLLCHNSFVIYNGIFVRLVGNKSFWRRTLWFTTVDNLITLNKSFIFDSSFSLCEGYVNCLN